ncbi:MAG TPA: 2-phosphosulfolactate phosphatase [Vicinamibacterales bacterium]
MNGGSVSITSFTDALVEYADDRALVAVDVIRATTTAVTAVSMGRECYVVPSLESALETASRVPNALLAGELGGAMPAGFELTNSPAQLAARSDISRPLVLLSSSGTRLMCAIGPQRSAYFACFRNYSATIEHLAHHHDAVTVIGAATHGDFREEDQMCCAWIAEGLIRSGFAVEDEMTQRLIERWRGAPCDGFLTSQSVAYLRRSGQLRDLDFILKQFDDVRTPGAVVTTGDTTRAVAVRG